jgi:oligogalacturonide lyase
MTPLFPLRHCVRLAAAVGVSLLFASGAFAKIGDRFPSEKKVVIDPVTGLPLTFLTSQPKGDSKIYQTHHQWTSDGKWVVFRSNRVRGQAMAVNEETGDIVQVTENGYSGMLCLAEHSMNLYFARLPGFVIGDVTGASSVPALTAAEGDKKGPGVNAPRGPAQIVRVDLGKLFADSAAGKVGKAEDYEHVCGTVPVEYGAIGDVALDPNEDFVYFGVKSKEAAAKHLDPAAKPAETFGPRKMGAGPNGLASMNLKTGEVKYIVSVPFQIGHVQTNPWVPGEIVFCWETGGKAPQRTWTVRSDGSGLRPVYAEAPYEWITHEAVITKDEVAFAIMGHRKPGTGVDKPDDWGISGTREHPTGLGIVNLRTREMRIAGQTKSGSGLWHVNGSGDGRWAVGDDFSRSVYLIDRHTDEMVMLTTGHKPTAADHPHPTFNSDGTKIEIESAMLSEDGKTMNICIVPVPESWLKRTYGSTKVQE